MITKNRLPLLIAAAGLLLILLWLGVKGWRIYRLTAALQAHGDTAKALLANGADEIDADAAVGLARAVRRDFLALEAETALLIPLTPYLSWLPKVGPLMPVAPQLLEMGDAGTEAGVQAAEALYPALAVMQVETLTPEERMAQLLAAVGQAAPALAEVEQSLARVTAARAAIPADTQLPQRAEALLSQFDALLPLAQGALKMAGVLPELLGQSGPKRYLIVAQNEDELRPTGGLISGAGLVTISNGRIANISFEDAYGVEDWTKPYDAPPEPLYQFMGSDLFVFRDSNFWPDFPTSAEQMMALYAYGRGVEVDGVIAIDQAFLTMLIGAIEPVSVPELDLVLTGESATASIQEAWATGLEEGGIAERKSFMGPMASAIRQRLETGLGEINLMGLAQTINLALAQKHLQLYVRHEGAMRVLSEMHWDGHIANQPGHDTLLVVNTNLGFNKANAVVENAIRYAVTLTEQPQAILQLDYTHRGRESAAPCSQFTSYKAGLRYADLVNRCYWNYVRVYAPTGSQLMQGSQHPVEADLLLTGRPWQGLPLIESDSTRLAIFANFFVVNQGAKLQASFAYQLPADVVQSTVDGAEQYRLVVFKQAGARPQPLQIFITLPPGSTLLNAQPAPTAVEGDRLTFQTTLDADATFVVKFRR